MKKDIHFVATFAIARSIGLSIEEARLIAWSNQYTDDRTKAGRGGIQTQAVPLGNWNDRQIQATVIIPFHFIPGPENWIVTPGNKTAIDIAMDAENFFELGIALHALQDTFSHQNFTGWNEPHNAVMRWEAIFIPNIGHADMRNIPDLTEWEWTDYRSGKKIINKERAFQCCELTHKIITDLKYGDAHNWHDISDKIKEILDIEDYKKRVKAFKTMGKCPSLSYKNLRHFQRDYRNEFTNAARKHLSRFFAYCFS